MDREAPLAAIAGRCPRSVALMCWKIKPLRVRKARLDRLDCRLRATPASRCSQRPKADLVGQRGNPHDVNLILGNTGAPRASARSATLAAHAGIPLSSARVDVSEK